jgi:hypothetical protein
MLGLYAEGPTDYDFLPPVIQRTAEQILISHEQFTLEALIYPINLPKDNQDSNILRAAKEACNYHVLIVHSDADHPTADKAKMERFNPGYELVQQCNESACKHLLPIIPIQTIEAWMMADHQLLRTKIGTRLSISDLEIPDKAKHVEHIADPKQKLKEIVRKAQASRSKRHHDADIRFLYQPLGEEIKLDRLKHVPSYAQFVQDLTSTLQSLNLIHRPPA